MAEDIGKDDNGRLVGADSDGVGAGGLDIRLNELFLFGFGRLGEDEEGVGSGSCSPVFC